MLVETLKKQTVENFEMQQRMIVSVDTSVKVANWKKDVGHTIMG